MEIKEVDIINIRPNSKRHHLFLIVLGCLLLMVSFFINMIFWQDYRPQLIFLMFASFIVLLIGYMKFTEPNISYQLTKKHINFIHRTGNWQVRWQDIIRIGDVKTVVGVEYVQLPYLGVKLNTLEYIAENMSPRLANKLIHEQQELLVLAVKNNEIVLDNGMISFEPFNLNGHVYKGPIAAWLFRTEQLVKIYGYHLFLSDNGFDRDKDEFLTLLKNCKNHISIF